MSAEIDSLRNLPVVDKLRVVTKLWDDIIRAGGPVIVPPEVLQEATRRSEELQADPSLALSDDELWRRVDGHD